ncbi:hypothetical protein [Bifidobacterium myosotis]|uniref:Uncharacterized protein n=1 Tax=Bifidobacterium myosotis TaxID=1630166 RepID=A0A5M9ZHJ9_9BIFI|nr:hypothetical protein [Bifidobacterium myosotis]KAA8826915.1 hypothetical protein EMO91_10305 [Bifidobacterium myosotis]
MLFDLTSISGQRVAQVDELHLGGRQWVSSTNVFIGAGGMLVGGIVGVVIRIMPFAAGQWWPFLAIPIFLILALVLFSRRRSAEGEKNARRIDRLLDKRHGMDGEFIRPGSLAPFDPGGYRLTEFHDHVIDRKDEDL